MEKYEISDPIGKIWNCNVYCWWNHRNFRGDFINLMIVTFIENNFWLNYTKEVLQRL